MSTQLRANVSFRPMDEHEVELLVDWAAAEGWNPDLHDAQCFWQADPHGYLALDVDGQLAGGGAIVRHNPKFGFMGLFIVKPEFRGRGYGRQLWFHRRDHLRERLAADGAIGLDAVANMIPFYAAGGFRAHTRHLRYQSPAAANAARKAHDSTEHFVSLHDVPFAEVVALDSRCFPGPREAYLRPWIDQPGAHALGFVEDGQLQGFGVMRPCITGWKIGPLHCHSPESANAMLRHFLSLAGDADVFIDVPENNPAAVNLCESLGMPVVFECTRMYLGPVPQLADEEIFGNTTLELG